MLQAQHELFTQKRTAIGTVRPVKLLQIGVFQMQDFIETMLQQIAIVRHCKQRARITVDEPAEPVQIYKIQKHVRLVQHQKVRRQQHFPHDLQQLVFSAADIRQPRVLQLAHACRAQLLADRAFVMLRVHGLTLIEQRLIACEQAIQFCLVEIRCSHCITGSADLR